MFLVSKSRKDTRYLQWEVGKKSYVMYEFVNNFVHVMWMWMFLCIC